MTTTTKTDAKTEDMSQKVDDALAAAKRAEAVLEEEPVATLQKKDEYNGYDVVQVVEAPKPYGGATSFAEVTEALKAQKTQYAVSDLFYVFDQIVSNIKSTDNEEMSPAEKADATLAAAKELASLLSTPTTGLTKIGMADAKETKRPLLERIKRMFGAKDDGYGSAFWSFIDTKGEWRWLTAYTNNFKDRDDEIFTEKAHKDFVKAANQLNLLPELWVWHTPGSRIGFCDLLDISDGFIVASGKYDPEFPEMGEKLAAKAEELGVSHGFNYPAGAKDDEGVFHRYFDFEISILPQRRAANPHMPLGNVLKEGTKMTFEKREELVDVLGEEKTAKLEAALGDKKEELLRVGFDWKAVDEALATPAAPAAEVAATADTPEGEEEDGDLATRVAKTEEQVGELVTGMNALIEATKAISVDLKALKRSDDEKIADEMSPRRREPTDPAARPSQKESTVIDTSKMSDEERAAIEGDDKETNQPENPAFKYVAPMLAKR